MKLIPLLTQVKWLLPKKTKPATKAKTVQKSCKIEETSCFYHPAMENMSAFRCNLKKGGPCAKLWVIRCDLCLPPSFGPSLPSEGWFHPPGPADWCVLLFLHQNGKGLDGSLLSLFSSHCILAGTVRCALNAFWDFTTSVDRSWSLVVWLSLLSSWQSCEEAKNIL